jgi:hypothetical protein
MKSMLNALPIPEFLPYNSTSGSGSNSTQQVPVKNPLWLQQQASLASVSSLEPAATGVISSVGNILTANANSIPGAGCLSLSCAGSTSFQIPLGNMMNSLLNSMCSGLHDIANAIASVIGSAISGIEGVFDGLMNDIAPITNFVEDEVSKMFSTVESMASALASKLSSVASAITSEFGSMISGLQNALSSVLPFINCIVPLPSLDALNAINFPNADMLNNINNMKLQGMSSGLILPNISASLCTSFNVSGILGTAGTVI